MFFYPEGKPMIPHLLRCQGLAVNYYGLTSAELSRCPPLDALDLGHPRLLQQQGKLNPDRLFAFPDHILKLIPGHLDMGDFLFALSDKFRKLNLDDLASDPFNLCACLFNEIRSWMLLFKNNNPINPQICSFQPCFLANAIIFFIMLITS